MEPKLSIPFSLLNTLRSSTTYQYDGKTLYNLILPMYMPIPLGVEHV